MKISPSVLKSLDTNYTKDTNGKLHKIERLHNVVSKLNDLILELENRLKVLENPVDTGIQQLPNIDSDTDMESNESQCSDDESIQKLRFCCFSV